MGTSTVLRILDPVQGYLAFVTGFHRSTDREASERSRFIHAPTVTVSLLRKAARVVEVATEQLHDEAIFFPPRDGAEDQPITLEGYVPLGDVGGLIRYIADMLEV